MRSLKTHMSKSLLGEIHILRPEADHICAITLTDGVLVREYVKPPAQGLTAPFVGDTDTIRELLKTGEAFTPCDTKGAINIQDYYPVYAVLNNAMLEGFAYATQHIKYGGDTRLRLNAVNIMRHNGMIYATMSDGYRAAFYPLTELDKGLELPGVIVPFRARGLERWIEPNQVTGISLVDKGGDLLIVIEQKNQRTIYLNTMLPTAQDEAGNIVTNYLDAGDGMYQIYSKYLDMAENKHVTGFEATQELRSFLASIYDKDNWQSMTVSTYPPASHTKFDYNTPSKNTHGTKSFKLEQYGDVVTYSINPNFLHDSVAALTSNEHHPIDCFIAKEVSRRKYGAKVSISTSHIQFTASLWYKAFVVTMLLQDSAGFAKSIEETKQ